LDWHWGWRSGDVHTTEGTYSASQSQTSTHDIIDFCVCGSLIGVRMVGVGVVLSSMLCELLNQQQNLGVSFLYWFNDVYYMQHFLPNFLSDMVY